MILSVHARKKVPRAASHMMGEVQPPSDSNTNSRSAAKHVPLPNGQSRWSAPATHLNVQSDDQRSTPRTRYPHSQSDDQRSTPRTRYPRLYVQSDSQPSCQASLPTHTRSDDQRCTQRTRYPCIKPAFYARQSAVYAIINSGYCTQRFTPVVQHPMMIDIIPL